jgi:hypothetical protein
MSILRALYRNEFWISVPLVGCGVCMLAFFIKNVVKLEDKNLIASVPLTAEQHVVFNEAGRILLTMEGPFFSTRFKKLSYEMIGSDGIAIPGQTTWLRWRSTSLEGRARLQLCSFELKDPGGYLLCIRGLGAPQAADVKHRIIFMKPHVLQTMACIVGIILGSFLAIGGLVLFIFRSRSKGMLPERASFSSY